jgi:hypothetical protein
MMMMKVIIIIIILIIRINPSTNNQDLEADIVHR